MADVEDGDLWAALREHFEAIQMEVRRLTTAAGRVEERLRRQRDARAALGSVWEYCERAGEALSTFGFEDWRLALEALRITVQASGREWSLTGVLPTRSVGVLIPVSRDEQNSANTVAFKIGQTTEGGVHAGGRPLAREGAL